jgi:hypothetical protein
MAIKIRERARQRERNVETSSGCQVFMSTLTSWCLYCIASRDSWPSSGVYCYATLHSDKQQWARMCQRTVCHIQKMFGKQRSYLHRAFFRACIIGSISQESYHFIALLYDRSNMSLKKSFVKQSSYLTIMYFLRAKVDSFTLVELNFYVGD